MNFQVYSATHHCHAGHRKATESRLVVRFLVGFMCTLCHIHLTADDVCVKWTEKNINSTAARSEHYNGHPLSIEHVP